MIDPAEDVKRFKKWLPSPLIPIVTWGVVFPVNFITRCFFASRWAKSYAKGFSKEMRKK